MLCSPLPVLSLLINAVIPLMAMVESGSFPGQTLQDDYVRHPVAGAIICPYAPLTDWLSVVHIENPLGRVHVISAGDQGCPGMALTSTTARKSACRVAINAGFFNMQTGDCIGNVISRGHLVQLSGLRNVNFGLTTSGEYVIGYLTKQSVISRTPIAFNELVAGVIWLLRDGRFFYPTSEAIESPDFMTMLAPRTIIGHDQAGRMMLVMVEGKETEGREAAGLTIPEVAQLALDLGMHNAVNLDGGGSSTLVLDGQVANKITEPCPDNPSRNCERPVTTIICIK